MARVRGYRRKRSYKGFLIFIVLALFVFLVVVLFRSGVFEDQRPSIALEFDGDGFWNPNKSIPMTFEDSSGIRGYKIYATLNDTKVIDIDEVVLDKPQKVKTILPRPNVPLKNGDVLDYSIEVSDWSNSNFFSGNSEKKHLKYVVDTIPPIISVLETSPKITYGGSAVLVFSAKDDNLKNLIVSNGVDDFKPFKFIKDGYYALLVAWPIKNKSFNLSILASDFAGNKTKINIPIIKHAKNYKVSNISLKQTDFKKLDSIISAIKARSDIASDVEKFKYLNEDIRSVDEEKIHKSAVSSFEDKTIVDIPLFEKFLPLKGAVVVGSFGDFRHYLFDKKEISLSYHMGLDMASVRNDSIYASNEGKVVFQDTLGVYGNTIVLYHQLGLSTLYSHISDFNTYMNSIVPKGSVIAYTGSSGWAFGDHLHFGVLVQGMAVWVSEWMDSVWIKRNVTNVLVNAKKTIENTQKGK